MGVGSWGVEVGADKCCVLCCAVLCAVMSLLCCLCVFVLLTGH